MDKKKNKHIEYLKNKAAWNEASKRWYQRNKEKVLERLKIDRITRPEFYRAKKREYFQENRDKILEYHRERNREIREEFIEKLGGRCLVCGEDNKRFLHLDRIKGGEHSRQAGWIRKNLKEFQILCANHHNEKTVYKQILWKNKILKF